jgi:spermidine synthase
MKAQSIPEKVSPHAVMLVLAAAFLAGFCTMSCEVLWFRVLKYFVDASIHSFAIMLTTFLFGLFAGGFLFSRIADTRKDPFLYLALIEVLIGFFCMISIPAISHLSLRIDGLSRLLGESWSAQIAIRFLVFSLVLFIPTALMGGVFPVASALYSRKSTMPGRSIGEIYGANTFGGILGSLAGGFVLIPVFGVQNSLVAVGLVNVFIGLACIAGGSSMRRTAKIIMSSCLIIATAVLLAVIPQNAFTAVYSSRYPEPANSMLYLKESINGTTAVFQNTGASRQKSMLIDGTGEVCTDYFSMRAFRFLGILPGCYASEAKNALVVTFGSGIVAGSIANLPGVERIECVEICSEAFNAARYFSSENHDILHNQKIHFIVNDGRNYVLTTRKTYDIISADATHPTSSDSWILYTQEFYGLCKSKLTDAGVMCQWLPLHGVPERNYRILIKTFHSVFPFVSVYFSGGNKTSGHIVLLGSKNPLKIDFNKAVKLFENQQIKDDLSQVNVFSVYDFLNGFIMDQSAIDGFSGDAALNTDDKPIVIFSKFKHDDMSYVGISPMIKFRMSAARQLCDTDSGSALQIKKKMEADFDAMGYSIDGQILEIKEYNMRMAQDFEHSRATVMNNLNESKALFERIIADYQAALQRNPDDFHTNFLLMRTASEYRYLMAFLDKVDAGAPFPTGTE